MHHEISDRDAMEARSGGSSLIWEDMHFKIILDELGQDGFWSFFQWWKNEATKEFLAHQEQMNNDFVNMQTAQRFAWV